MKKIHFIPVFAIFLSIQIACSERPALKTESHKKKEVSQKKKERPNSVKMGKVFYQNGKKFLYGGEKEYQHFDITDWDLNDSQLHYGIGREYFHALIEPKFVSIDEANKEYEDTSRFLLGVVGDEAKAYSIELLTHHEIVNDVLGGKPVMAAYCHLADLGAIYSRVYDNKEFTFGLSGYTYYDKNVWDGLDGFLLWDRETESIWWPLTGFAVSGLMKGKKLKVLDETSWSQTTWGDIKSKHKNVLVLAKNQKMDEPENWKKYSKEMINTSEQNSDEKHLAPKWGKNSSI